MTLDLALRIALTASISLALFLVGTGFILLGTSISLECSSRYDWRKTAQRICVYLWVALLVLAIVCFAVAAGIGMWRSQ